MNKTKAIFVVGPTASGKTALSIEIAKKYGGEIVSADSMQIYKGIHIASAAPDDSEKGSIKHHLLEFLELTDEFSVADYVKEARKCIAEISSKGKLPVIAGGTGLYISSLLDNIEYPEQKTDFALRKRLEEEFDKVGSQEMLRRLAEFDPESAERLHPNNRRRIIRAFEVYSLTGKTATELNRLSKLNPCCFDSLVIGITYKDREKLYERINKRVDIMLENGLLQEACANFTDNTSLGAFQAIGHKELYGYFNNECTLQEAIEHLKRQTRRYAKRQLTWFCRDERVNWIYADETESVFSEADCLIEKFLRSDT